MKPLNGNVLVKPIKNHGENVFSEGDSRKDLQYAEVITTCKYAFSGSVLTELPKNTSVLKEGGIIVYNPRSLTNITYDGKLLGMLHENQIISIV